MDYTIQIRRDNAATWTSVNPTLAVGEWGYELDTQKLKVGDGVSNWVTLPYYTPASSSIQHNVTSGIQGGNATERYHLTATEHDTVQHIKAIARRAAIIFG